MIIFLLLLFQKCYPEPYVLNENRKSERGPLLNFVHAAEQRVCEGD